MHRPLNNQLEGGEADMRQLNVEAFIADGSCSPRMPQIDEPEE